jgi:hypothetical protein
MPLNAMRIGETIAVEGKPIDSLGDPTDFLLAETWDSSSDAVATVTPDGENPRLAEVEAIAPGTATVTFEGGNQFSDPVSITAQVRVLDASALRIQFGAALNMEVSQTPNLVTIIPEHENSPGGVRLAVAAIPIDERDRTGGDRVDYAARGLTSIEWHTDNQRILFDKGFGPDPTSTGDLTLDLVPNLAGEDVVYVSAVNSLGQTITGQFNVLVLATAGVVIVDVATDSSKGD